MPPLGGVGLRSSSVLQRWALQPSVLSLTDRSFADAELLFGCVCKEVGGRQRSAIHQDLFRPGLFISVDVIDLSGLIWLLNWLFSMLGHVQHAAALSWTRLQSTHVTMNEQMAAEKKWRQMLQPSLWVISTDSGLDWAKRKMKGIGTCCPIAGMLVPESHSMGSRRLIGIASGPDSDLGT